MKLFSLRSLSLAVGLLVASHPSLRADDSKTQNFAVTGMHCQPCADAITGAVSKIEGVSTVTVKFAEKEAAVTYDDAKTTADAIVAKIKETGYDAKAIAK